MRADIQEDRFLGYCHVPQVEGQAGRNKHDGFGRRTVQGCFNTCVRNHVENKLQHTLFEDLGFVGRRIDLQDRACGIQVPRGEARAIIRE